MAQLTFSIMHQVVVQSNFGSHFPCLVAKTKNPYKILPSESKRLDGLDV